MGRGVIQIKEPMGHGIVRMEAIDPKTDAKCKIGSAIPFKISPSSVKKGSQVVFRVVTEGTSFMAVEIKSALSRNK